MTPPAWQAVNDEYLTAALAWLRDRLSAEPGQDEPAGAFWEMASPDGTMPPALELLGDALGLSRFERLVLLLCVAMELDRDMAECCTEASGQTAAFPTFALALGALPDPSWDVVSPYRPLRYWRLIEIHQHAGQPLALSRLRADERIVNYVRGLNDLDDRLEYLVRPVPSLLGRPLPPTQEAAVGQVLGAWTGKVVPPVVALVGRDPAVLRGIAAEVASRLGLALFELPLDRLPSPRAEVGPLLRLWRRETLLQPMALYLDASEMRPEEATAVSGLLSELDGAVLMGCREPWPVPERALRIVEADRPTPAEQEDLWTELLGPDQAGIAGMLAAQFDLNQIVIRQVVARGQEGEGDSGQLWRACQEQTRPRLESLAQRIDPVATWDDLVLPEDSLRLLQHLVEQVRGRSTVLRHWGFGERLTRGTGITALFSGPSGTGKTLAAEVVASAVGLSLYRIDLSGVVSKYIGETERNLRRVFDAADEGGALLLFDEADALFGKRSEVKDSHDRYANIEVNYLLQRMEDYRGVAVLATNQRNALDQAFLRRLRLVVTFPFPSRTERVAIWERAFPAATPVEGLDVERLSELVATGGMIRNIALNAAFCAAGLGTPVTMGLLLETARAEFVKFDMPLSERDFRPVQAVGQ